MTEEQKSLPKWILIVSGFFCITGNYGKCIIMFFAAIGSGDG